MTTILAGTPLSGLLERPPAAIGPVISGSDGIRACYYVDLLYEGGQVQRLFYPKDRGFDPRVKRQALMDRALIAKRLEEAVLLHDQRSFDNLTAKLERLSRLLAIARQDRG